MHVGKAVREVRGRAQHEAGVKRGGTIAAQRVDGVEERDALYELGDEQQEVRAVVHDAELLDDSRVAKVVVPERITVEVVNGRARVFRLTRRR